jgi:hypothetical protein
MSRDIDRALPQYQVPVIDSLRDEDLAENVGPAQAYTGSFPFSF